MKMIDRTAEPRSAVMHPMRKLFFGLGAACVGGIAVLMLLDGMIYGVLILGIFIAGAGATFPGFDNE
jgi:tetrahydromethanopterin S-methyltransferase subunit F